MATAAVRQGACVENMQHLARKKCAFRRGIYIQRPAGRKNGKRMVRVGAASSASASASSGASDGGTVASLVAKSSERTEEIMRTIAAGVEDGRLGEKGENLSVRSTTTSPGSQMDDSVRTKIEAGVRKLGAGLVERETECRLLMLACLCAEHVILFGPPGTAKSELGRRLSTICKGGNFFSRLLTRFSVPEELFGPLSMVALENDEYVRKIDGYLPQSEVAFIDEVFKANSAILNSLLTILNERLFDNGTERMEVPLLVLVGASNELPESEELDALYDRFLIRKEVQQVSEGAIKELLEMSFGDEGESAVEDQRDDIVFSKEEFTSIGSTARATVEVPENVVYLLSDLRRHLQEEVEPPVYVSDRRLIKVVNLLRVVAYTNNRARVSEFDCLLLRHCLWNRPEESLEIARWVNERVTTMQLQGIEQIQYMLAGMFGRACRTMDKITMSRVEAGRESEGADGEPATASAATAGGADLASDVSWKSLVQDPSAVAEFENLMEEVGTIKELVMRRLCESRDAEAYSNSILSEHLWLSEDDKAESIQMSAQPMAKAKKELGALLSEVVTLETALLDRVEPVILAELLPSYWSAFIRKGNIAEIRKLGLK